MRDFIQRQILQLAFLFYPQTKSAGCVRGETADGCLKTISTSNNVQALAYRNCVLGYNYEQV